MPAVSRHPYELQVSDTVRRQPETSILPTVSRRRSLDRINKLIKRGRHGYRSKVAAGAARGRKVLENECGIHSFVRDALIKISPHGITPFISPRAVVVAIAGRRPGIYIMLFYTHN